MSGKKHKRNLLWRSLAWTFWLSLFSAVGFTWYYVERRIPDHLSVVVNEREEFDFALPFDVSLLSDSEEVEVGGSEIKVILGYIANSM